MKKSVKKKIPSSPVKSKKENKDDDWDEAVEETFPASDAIAKYQGVNRDKKK